MKKGKQRKRLKLLTPNKQFTRLQVSLVQIKDKNSSYILKNEIRERLYFHYQHNKITNTLYNSLIKSV